jgi:hypothetical protein
MWLGTSVVLGLCGFVWLIAHCPWWHQPNGKSQAANELAYWLIAAWFLGLLLSTPLYTPYPRLSLPWLLAAWIAFAAMLGSPGVQRMALGQAAWQSSRKGSVCLFALGAVSLMGFADKLMIAPPRPPAMWEDRKGLESIASEIHEHVAARHDDRAVVYVYAEPALLYHLHAMGMNDVAPVAHLGITNQSVPILLAVGPHAKRSEAFQEEFQRSKDRWELVGQYAYEPSRLVLLDQFSPAELEELNFPSAQSVEVYLLKPP